MNKLCEVGVPDVKHVWPFEHGNSALINLTTKHSRTKLAKRTYNKNESITARDTHNKPQ